MLFESHPELPVAGTGMPFLIDSLCERLPTCSLGVDFDVQKGLIRLPPVFFLIFESDSTTGLVKLWHFGRYTVGEAVDQIPEIPTAVKDYLPFFSKYGLEQVYCIGV